MSYQSFTTIELKQKFGVEQILRQNVFNNIKPRAISDWLRMTLTDTVDFALTLGTEKARSEFIIAPIFFELRKQSHKQISVFSGLEFNVDKRLGLNGFADFLVSRSAYQAALEAPVVVAVEAKRQDFERGFTQCIAEMIAARIYNERQQKEVAQIYGCVTTGDIWRFLVLRGNLAEIDTKVFELSELEQIFGVLWAMTFDEITS